MEIILNLAWIFLAAVIVWLWLRYAPCEGANRRTQVAALAMLIVILFPVISVSDDLQALQNPAESDTFQCQRRDCLAGSSHAVHPAIAALPEPVFAEAVWSFQRYARLNFSSRAVENPAFDTIQNRPPPAA